MLAPDPENYAIRARGVTVGFGGVDVLKDLDLDVRRGEILGFVGASGAGKSVLMRTILGLNSKQGGTIELLGHDLDSMKGEARIELDMRMGVLFQHGALFSGLTVLENIQVPMREYLSISRPLMRELAMLKLQLVGLKPGDATKSPSELSGGMIKRAALARALALDPDIVFLDEPTSGLDPISAADFDELIAQLRDTLGLTVYMVTHDLDSLFSVTDRVAVLGDRKVIANGDLQSMLDHDHAWIRSYFQGKRARQIVRTDRAAKKQAPHKGPA